MKGGRESHQALVGKGRAPSAVWWPGEAEGKWGVGYDLDPPRPVPWLDPLGLR
jgi:hypothetical protein